MRSPRILGKIRTALKFVNAAMQKHLSTYDFHTIVLDNNNAANNNTATNNVATKLISHTTSAVLDIQSALISTGNQNRHNSDTGGLGWTASGKYYNSGGRTIHLFHPKLIHAICCVVLFATYIIRDALAGGDVLTPALSARKLSSHLAI